MLGDFPPHPPAPPLVTVVTAATTKLTFQEIAKYELIAIKSITECIPWVAS